jgi:hypothetical protein
MKMLFNPGPVERSNSTFLADLIELMVFFEVDGKANLSKQDVLSFFKISQSSFNDLDSLDQEEQLLDGADFSERQYQYVDDCWAQLEYRLTTLKENYPYILRRNKLYLNKNLGAAHSLYIFLLCCSRLRSFESSIRVKWAGFFSKFSCEVMKSFFPIGASCKIFDANSTDRRNYYGTALGDALNLLSKDINCDLSERARVHPSGDKGIDIVGHMYIGDTQPTNHVLFGQCAARKDEWPSKTLEASAHNLRGVFHFRHDPGNVVFIPLCFRTSNGEWYTDHLISGYILVDRIRAFNMLSVSQKCSIANNDWFVSFLEEVGYFNR